MTKLTIHNTEVRTVFDLLGTTENDLSYSLGWVLAQCPPVIDALVKELTGRSVATDGIDGVEVRLQQHSRTDRGYTDLELVIPGHCYFIFEMKKGWNLPSPEQLARYSNRPELLDKRLPERRMVTFSECSATYAQLHCPVQSFPHAQLSHCNWPQLLRALDSARPACGHKQKQLIDEFKNYIKHAVSMRSIDTNWVWVVALTDDCMEGWTLSFKDVVDEHRKYFHSVKKGDPPTYIGFKYKGRLHSIHFIEDYEIIHDASPIFDQPNGKPFGEPHYLYTLGPPIKPAKEVKYGKIWNSARNWVMLDTLLTSSTIEEAIQETKKRAEDHGLV